MIAEATKIETPEELVGIVDFSQIVDWSPSPVRLRLTPHPAAPLFSEIKNGRLVLKADAHERFADIMDIASVALRTGVHQTSERVIVEAYRQAGLVNLWFYLRVICSVTGPYESLTDHLHADMCNFYQITYERPGSKAFGAIGRSHYKSSVWTHGPVGWEITRDPESTHAIASSIIDRAQEFLHIIQSVILDNPLYRLCYPENVPVNPRTLPGWNDNELTLPSKQRNRRSPNVILIAAGGSSAGIHVGKLHFDDIITEQQLDSQRGSAADMMRYTNWLKTGIRTLVRDWKGSQVFGCGTRYAVDDAYQWIFENCKEAYGFWDDLDEAPREDGEWLVYYRTMVENNHIVFPESFTLKGLAELDRWTAATQYWNNPKLAGTNELILYKIGDASVEFNEKLRKFVVTYGSGAKLRVKSLFELDVRGAHDPAASEGRRSGGTSRTAQGVGAMDEEGNVIFLEIRAGYFATSKVLENAFAMYEKWNWKSYYLEQNGPFKLLGPIFRDAQNERRIYLRVGEARAKGNKEERIRAAWEPLFAKGRIFATPQAKAAIMQELRGFPMAKMKDVLDMGAILISNLHRPVSQARRLEDEERAERRRSNVNKTTGY